MSVKIGRKKINRRKVLLIVVGVFLGLYALQMLLPLYFVVINSLKPAWEFFENPWVFPTELFLDNYKAASELGVGDVSLPTMFLNSIILTGAATLIGTAAVTVSAYTLAKFNFIGKGILVSIGVGAMLIPDLGSGAVVYKMFVDLNMIDSWTILVKYASPFGLMFLIMYSNFIGISNSYAEAARMDGASEFRIFLQIMVPMAKGTIGMMMVMSAIGCWNDYYTPYMYLPSVKTLALGLQELSEEAQAISNFPEVYAAMVIALTPLLILFICMRDTIIENAVAGGLKG